MFNLINKVMKHKFLVVRIYKHSSPSIVEELDNVSDASAMANIMRRKNDGYEYVVYQLNEEL